MEYFLSASHWHVKESPIGVLKAVANRLRCPYDQIEQWLDRFYGTKTEIRPKNPEQRLDQIRQRMSCDEAERIEARASQLFHEAQAQGLM